MRHLLIALLFVGCSGKKHDAPPAETKPTAGSGAGSAVTGPDASCVDATAKLKAWLGELVTLAPQTVNASGVELVKLEDQAPKAVPAMPTIVITPSTVTFEGRMLTVVPKADAKPIKDALAAAHAGTDAMFLIDANVPWTDVVTVANAARDAGRTHATFVFAAGVPPKITPPPPSAVDKELDALARPDPAGPTPKLYDSKDPNHKTIPDKIFKDCPATDLFNQIGAAEGDARNKLVVDGFPAAIAACNCKVEMASVQRLLWSWYGRDTGGDILGVSVELSPKGTVVSAKSTWSAGAKALVGAATEGKPIALK